MNKEVKDYLNTQCNDNGETYYEFIRSSEKVLGVDTLPLEDKTLEEVVDYVDFLDYLWNK